MIQAKVCGYVCAHCMERIYTAPKIRLADNGKPQFFHDEPHKHCLPEREAVERQLRENDYYGGMFP